MPHFGLMDPDALGPVEGALQRAKLHIRAGKRRLRQGKTSAGIVTLQDALSNAMLWSALSNKGGKALKIHQGESIYDDKTLFTILVRSEILDTQFDYDSFDALVERALEEDIADLESAPLVSSLEGVMTQLGVMPFDEAALPPEDPKTF